MDPGTHAFLYPFYPNCKYNKYNDTIISITGWVSGYLNHVHTICTRNIKVTHAPKTLGKLTAGRLIPRTTSICHLAVRCIIDVFIR